MYVLTTAKLDATGHRWVAALVAYNFTLNFVGLCQSWLTMDDDSPSITCPDCLLSLGSTSYGCTDQCESDKLCHIGHICVLALVCWQPFPFCGLASLLLPLSASFHQTAAVCEVCFSSWCGQQQAPPRN